MTYGFSRDDSGPFLQDYLSKGLFDKDPFQILDEVGVGELMEMAVEKGRSVREDLKMGICGEHGGEPSSVEFCHRIGLNYVSCSPYRVPIARLAAAQAVIKEAMQVREQRKPAKARKRQRKAKKALPKKAKRQTASAAKKARK
jgi:pyruvate,orthophosphate dikinase